MKPPVYPFAAIVGQERLKMALLLAAVDWRLGVLLRGDKGTGKTTAARALAELLPEPGRFVNLPLGVTEDRLLGGLDLAQTLQGKPVLRKGLLSEAHRGVLYVDEVNLLPDHLADALLDAAATGMHTLEREGFSAAEHAHFTLMGSMNPEEGSLRPQLLDRFALVVDVTAPHDPGERRDAVARRLSYDADPEGFVNSWTREQSQLRKQIVQAQEALASVQLGDGMLSHISKIVTDHGVASLRADLAIARASAAYAALRGQDSVLDEHIEAVLPLALLHRVHSPRKPPAPGPQPSRQDLLKKDAAENDNHDRAAGEKKFASAPVDVPELRWKAEEGISGTAPAHKAYASGPVIGTRKAERPRELDARPSVMDALAHTGSPQPSPEHLHEKVRDKLAPLRFLFVVDSSGSHAVRERMSAVKGAAVGLIEKSVHRRDEVAIIAFRGASAEVLVEPTRDVAAVRASLEYLPTGGRTPLAHALQLAKRFVDDKTLLILLTDGRTNVPLSTDDPWCDAVNAATQIPCRILVVDTEFDRTAMGVARKFAESIHADCVRLEDLEKSLDPVVIDRR